MRGQDPFEALPHAVDSDCCAFVVASLACKKFRRHPRDTEQTTMGLVHAPERVS